MILLLIGCVIYGIVSIAAPEPIWRLGERLRYKEEREPSAAGLALIRGEGVAIIAAALFGLLRGCGG